MSPFWEGGIVLMSGAIADRSEAYLKASFFGGLAEVAGVGFERQAGVDKRVDE